MKNSERYVSVQLLNIILAYAASNNFDINHFLKLSGIEHDILTDKDARIEIGQFYKLVSAAAGMSGEELTGLHLAEKVNNIYSKNHILMTIMSNCPNLGKAIDKLIQYHDISSNSIKLHKEKKDKFTSLSWESYLQDETGLGGIFLEAALTSCAIMFKDFTMGKASFLEVNFTLPEPKDKGEYVRVFGCPVVFDSKENKIVFSNEDMLLPITLSDPELLGMLEIYAQKILSKGSRENILSEKIINCLSEMIIQGRDYNIDEVAGKMAVSPRTLQKHLENENTTYRKLLEQVKKRIAVKSLENSELPLTDIAFLLGFSEQSAFNHAFKKWTGLSPKKFRNQN